MTPLNPFRKVKSLAELEDETDKLEAEDENLGRELSITQKRVAIAQLKKRGLAPKHFGFDYKKIWQWLRSH
jgi:hypothetical protein